MKFLRIADQNNRGPYSNQKARDLMIDFFYSLESEQCPNPSRDSKLSVAAKVSYKDEKTTFWGNFLFGFSSMEQFRAWFNNDGLLRGLGAMGFTLNVYKFDKRHIFVGHAQSVVNKRRFKDMSPVQIFSLDNIPQIV